MKTETKLLIAALALTLPGIAQGQGTMFVNLDFENPILPLTPIGHQVPITNALPGWPGYLGGSQVIGVAYDEVSLESAKTSSTIKHPPGSPFKAIIPSC